jgi:hypothetical protein
MTTRVQRERDLKGQRPAADGPVTSAENQGQAFGGKQAPQPARDILHSILAALPQQKIEDVEHRLHHRIDA